MSNGLLLRVGIDSTSGGWNAPCRRDGSFCYVPVPENQTSHRWFDHRYDEFSPFVTAIGDVWPELSGVCHLDPDFAHLTYGDAGSRAQRISEFILPGSFVVFWSALRWLDGPQQGRLVCSIIGFYEVYRVSSPNDIDILDSHRNAHTRRSALAADHIVVFADPRKSGRLRRHLPIGDGQTGDQRVFPDLLDAWGGLCRKTGEPLKNGYIQRRANPPIFSDPAKFLKWFRARKPKLVHANNV
jgi:hypothetical protein